LDDPSAGIDAERKSFIQNQSSGLKNSSSDGKNHNEQISDAGLSNSRITQDRLSFVEINSAMKDLLDLKTERIRVNVDRLGKSLSNSHSVTEKSIRKKSAEKSLRHERAKDGKPKILRNKELVDVNALTPDGSSKKRKRKSDVILGGDGSISATIKKKRRKASSKLTIENSNALDGPTSCSPTGRLVSGLENKEVGFQGVLSGCEAATPDGQKYPQVFAAPNTEHHIENKQLSIQSSGIAAAQITPQHSSAAIGKPFFEDSPNYNLVIAAIPQSSCSSSWVNAANLVEIPFDDISLCASTQTISLNYAATSMDIPVQTLVPKVSPVGAEARKQRGRPVGSRTINRFLKSGLPSPNSPDPVITSLAVSTMSPKTLGSSPPGLGQSVDCGGLLDLTLKKPPSFNIGSDHIMPSSCTVVLSQIDRSPSNAMRARLNSPAAASKIIPGLRTRTPAGVSGQSSLSLSDHSAVIKTAAILNIPNCDQLIPGRCRPSNSQNAKGDLRPTDNSSRKADLTVGPVVSVAKVSSRVVSGGTNEALLPVLEKHEMERVQGGAGEIAHTPPKLIETKIGVSGGTYDEEDLEMPHLTLYA